MDILTFCTISVRVRSLFWGKVLIDGLPGFRGPFRASTAYITKSWLNEVLAKDEVQHALAKLLPGAVQRQLIDGGGGGGSQSGQISAAKIRATCTLHDNGNLDCNNFIRGLERLAEEAESEHGTDVPTVVITSPHNVVDGLDIAAPSVPKSQSPPATPPGNAEPEGAQGNAGAMAAGAPSVPDSAAPSASTTSDTATVTIAVNDEAPSAPHTPTEPVTYDGLFPIFATLNTSPHNPGLSKAELTLEQLKKHLSPEMLRGLPSTDAELMAAYDVDQSGYVPVLHFINGVKAMNSGSQDTTPVQRGVTEDIGCHGRPVLGNLDDGDANSN